MKLQQFKCLCEIVQCGLSVTRAADRLHLSQPGVSRHIHLLEEELGVPIFVRKENKLVALTPIGESVHIFAKRVLNDTDNLKKLAAEARSGAVGDLIIATSPIHTRYSLPPVLERFTKMYPQVRLSLRENYGSKSALCVNLGEADIAISSYPVERFPEMIFLPCHSLHRVILTPRGHPLLKIKNVELTDLMRYPIITYNTESLTRIRIMDAFTAQGLKPNIILSSFDADTIKRYVLSGIGIAIVSHTAYEPEKDQGLKAIDAMHLFGMSAVNIGLRRHAHLPRYMLSFIEMFAPSLPAVRVQEMIESAAQDA